MGKSVLFAAVLAVAIVCSFSATLSKRSIRLGGIPGDVSYGDSATGPTAPPTYKTETDKPKPPVVIPAPSPIILIPEVRNNIVDGMNNLTHQFTYMLRLL